MELLQDSIAAVLLRAMEPPEKRRHAQLINLNTVCNRNSHKNSYSCQHSPNPPAAEAMEEYSQTSVVTQLDLNENNGILLQGNFTTFTMKALGLYC